MSLPHYQRHDASQPSKSGNPDILNNSGHLSALLRVALRPSPGHLLAILRPSSGRPATLPRRSQAHSLPPFTALHQALEPPPNYFPNHPLPNRISSHQRYPQTKHPRHHPPHFTTFDPISRFTSPKIFQFHQNVKTYQIVLCAPFHYVSLCFTFHSQKNFPPLTAPKHTKTPQNTPKRKTHQHFKISRYHYTTTYRESKIDQMRR